MKKIFESNEITSDDLKKITVSNFLTKDFEFIIDKNYSIKISSIDSEVTLKLLKLLFMKKLNKEELNINNNRFYINNVYHSNNLCRQFILDSFDEEYDYKEEITLNFITPTFFKIGSRISSIDSLDYIFKNIVIKMKKSSIWEELKEVSNFELSKIELDSHLLRPKTIKELGIDGFVGKVKFILKDYTFEELYIFNVLANFAFFSGVGYMTEKGYGQCEIIKN
ncbi:CRISPR system precrRNA processing endoribonuclease RAMP protein Cas6 [Fusobacterium sp. PH5-29]|uniref:CRISPR system precrRNA processing endoribonuclease RAMP protein Cas6 n=1 Tax=Fusobacterium sp. PH5-29 TaxID=1742400 RepID=UPI003D19D055